MPLDPVSAQMLLLKCQGDEIWDAQTCQSAGVPQNWIEELRDRYESGYDTDRNTIYQDGKMVNQYEGISDLHLAYKLAEYLGIDWKRASATAISRRGIVAAHQSRVGRAINVGPSSYDNIWKSRKQTLWRKVQSVVGG